MTPEEERPITITVPKITGEEADKATDLVEQLVDQYTLSPADTDALFQAMVTVFIRDRMIYGDRKPSVCSFAGMHEGGSEGQNP